MVQIDKCLIKMNLRLFSIITEDRKIGERLPKLERKSYVFEANNQTELPRLIAQLVEKCVDCIEQGKKKIPRIQ